MARCLFHELTTMDEYKCLRSILGRRFDTVNELGEDDLRAG